MPLLILNNNMEKTYLNPAEEQHRYSTFKANFDFVANWDSNARGFEVGINQFADLTSSEFVSIYNGMNVTRQPVYRAGKPTDVNVEEDKGSRHWSEGSRSMWVLLVVFRDWIH